jgi:hypothetical protein
MALSTHDARCGIQVCGLIQPQWLTTDSGTTGERLRRVGWTPLSYLQPDHIAGPTTIKLD